MAIANPPAVAPDQKGVMIADPAADAASKLEKVLISGDLAQLTPEQRVFYYNEVCSSAGLNPLTRPFDYLSLNGKLVLYANKSCTDQVRRVNRIEIVRLERDRADDLAIVTAYARDHTGRQDSAMGAVSIAGLKGEALANALMKAETKAKRRVTLALSGLGLLDEIEVDSAPGAWRQEVDMATGELLTGATGATAGQTLEERIAAQAAAMTTTTSAPASGGTGAAQPEEAPRPASSGGPEPAGGHPSSPPPAGSTAPDDDVIDGEAVEVQGVVAEGVSAGELREWLRDHKVSITVAREACMRMYRVDSFDAISDEQRGHLILELDAGRAAS